MMQRFSPMLLFFLWRQAFWVHVVAVLIAGSSALFWPGRLIWPVISHNNVLLVLVIMVFLFVHCVALVIVQGRPSSGTFAFTYTRGFTRDQLWLHQVLASLGGAGVVLLTVVVITFLPIRSTYQDLVNVSPYYPGAAAFERAWLWRPLAGYALLLPVLHYVWIRMAQPMRGGLSGFFLLVIILLAALINTLYDTELQLHTRLTASLLTIAATLLFIWGWRLHRTVEVTR